MYILLCNVKLNYKRRQRVAVSTEQNNLCEFRLFFHDTTLK